MSLNDALPSGEFARFEAPENSGKGLRCAGQMADGQYADHDASAVVALEPQLAMTAPSAARPESRAPASAVPGCPPVGTPESALVSLPPRARSEQLRMAGAADGR